MKKKDVVVKLHLNRETLRALEQGDLKDIRGGAVSGLYSCKPCSHAPTDLC